MLNQYAVDNPTLPVNKRFFPLFRDPGGMLSRSLVMPSRNDRPPSIWDTHGVSGNVFANPSASSSAPYPQQSSPWISNVSEHTSPHVMSESQIPVHDQRCQSRPSARNSFNPSEGRCSKDYGADQQRLQISDPHFDKFLNPATFACWKKIQDRGIRIPDFEELDAKIASALNRIIHNTHFKKKVSLEESPQRGRLSPWKTDRLRDLRVLPGHWCQRFCRELCRPIYCCSSK